MDVQNSTYKIRYGDDSQVGVQTRGSERTPSPLSALECRQRGELFGVAKDDYKLGGGRDNCGNYLLRAVIGAVEMPKIERHPHKVGNSARLHLLHDRGPVMLGCPRADP